MSPGFDFQEAFLFLYSDAIMLILGLTLAVGVLLAIAGAFVYVPMGPVAKQETEEDES